MILNQAIDSVTGEKFTWSTDAYDALAAAYPGPNQPTNLIVLAGLQQAGPQGPIGPTGPSAPPGPDFSTPEKGLRAVFDVFFDFTNPDTYRVKSAAVSSTSIADWSLSGLTAIGNVLSESGNAIRSATLLKTNAIGVGYCKATLQYRCGMPAWWLDWYFYAAGAGDAQYSTIAPSALWAQPDGFRRFGTTPTLLGGAWSYGLDVSVDDTGLVTQVHETSIDAASVNSSVGGVIKSQFARAALAGRTVEIDSIKLEQDRVISVTPSWGDHEHVLLQPVDAQRFVRAPLWIGGGTCLSEAHEETVSASVNLGSGSTAFSLALVLSLGCPSGVYNAPIMTTRAATVLTLTGATASVSVTAGADAKWHLTRVTDTGETDTITTGIYVACVPAVMWVQVAGETVSLYIDGVLAGTITRESTTTTLTTAQLAGNKSSALFGSLGWSDSPIGSTVMAQATTAMRTYASLPDTYDVWLSLGDTGAMTTVPQMASSYMHVTGARPGAAVYVADDRTDTAMWDLNLASPKGAAWGIANAATAAGNCALVISAAYEDDPWTTLGVGGDATVFLGSMLPNALARIGTPYHSFAGAIVSGMCRVEARANTYNAAQIQGQISVAEVMIRNIIGQDVPIIWARHNTWLDAAREQPNAEAVLTGFDNWAAGSTAKNHVYQADGPERNGMHLYPLTSEIYTFGRSAYAIAKGGKVNVIPRGAGYPSPFSWAGNSGAWYDAEHGLPSYTSGTYITSWAPREGSGTLAIPGGTAYFQRSGGATEAQIIFLPTGYGSARGLATEDLSAYNGDKALLTVALCVTTYDSYTGTVLYLGKADGSQYSIKVVRSSSGVLTVTRKGAGGVVTAQPILEGDLTGGFRQAVGVIVCDGTSIYTVTPDGRNSVDLGTGIRPAVADTAGVVSGCDSYSICGMPDGSSILGGWPKLHGFQKSGSLADAVAILNEINLRVTIER